MVEQQRSEQRLWVVSQSSNQSSQEDIHRGRVLHHLHQLVHHNLQEESNNVFKLTATR